MLAEDAIKAAIRDYHAKIQGKKDISGSIDVSQSVRVMYRIVHSIDGTNYNTLQVSTGQTVAEARPGQH